MKAKLLGRLIFVTLSVFLSACQHEQYRIHILFEDVHVLVPGHAVECKGVRIGDVESIKPQECETVVTCWIDPTKMKVPANSNFIIRTRDALGAPYVEVLTDAIHEPFLSGGDTIVSRVVVEAKEDTSALKDLVPLVNKLSKKMKQVSKEYKKLEKEKEVQDQWDSIQPISPQDRSVDIK